MRDGEQSEDSDLLLTNHQKKKKKKKKLKHSIKHIKQN